MSLKEQTQRKLERYWYRSVKEVVTNYKLSDISKRSNLSYFQLWYIKLRLYEGKTLKYIEYYFKHLNPVRLYGDMVKQRPYRYSKKYIQRKIDSYLAKEIIKYLDEYSFIYLSNNTPFNYQQIWRINRKLRNGSTTRNIRRFYESLKQLDDV